MSKKTFPGEVRYAHGYEVRDMQAEGRYLDCVVTTYGVENDVGPFFETMDKGVFGTTLAHHADQVKLIVGHNDEVPAVGTPVSWEDTDTELRAVYQFLTHKEAKKAARIAGEGGFAGVSVGFLPGKKPHHNTWTKDSQGGIHVARHEARLLHLGMVVTPANPGSEILEIRSMGVPEDVVLRTPRLDDARSILERIRAGRISV